MHVGRHSSAGEIRFILTFARKLEQEDPLNRDLINRDEMKKRRIESEARLGLWIYG